LCVTDSKCLLEVSRIAFGPKPYDKELVDVGFDGSQFVITTPSGFSKGNVETLSLTHTHKHTLTHTPFHSLPPPPPPPRFIHTMMQA
jgi:hypothetical protein